MPAIDNLNKSEFEKLADRVRVLETAPQLSDSSVSIGQTQFIGNESLKVIGSAVVSGWLIVTGTLKLVGTLLIEGVTTITGAFNLSGPATISGETSITGAVDIEGALKILGEALLDGTLTVGAGGEIKVGAMTLSPGEYSGVAGQISAPIAVNVVAPLFSVSADSVLGGDVTVVGTMDMPFLPERVGTPLVIDAFGRIDKAPA